MTASLASDLAVSLEPTLLIDWAGLEPDTWQKDLLRSSARRVLLLCARQTGKSTTTALLALHQACTNRPQRS